MLVSKKRLIMQFMAIIMFHLSFISIREEYFLKFLDIQRVGAILFLLIVTFNINRYLDRKYIVMNIAIIAFSISIGYTSFINRDLSGYGIMNIVFSVVKTIAPLLAMEYANETGQEREAVNVLFVCSLIYCGIVDIHAFSTGIIGQDKTNLLIGNKFNVSYLHIFALALYAYLQEDKKRVINLFLVSFWCYTFYISIITTCTTAAIACVIFAILFLNYHNVEKTLKKPWFAVALIAICDSILIINSNIVTWEPIRNFIENVLHEDVTLTGRMGIYQNIMKLLVMQPWFGFGPENNYTMSHTVALGGNTQNGMADIIVSYGIIGAFIIISFMIISILYSKEKMNRSFFALLYTFVLISCVEITLGKELLIVIALLAFTGRYYCENEEDEEMEKVCTY